MFLDALFQVVSVIAAGFLVTNIPIALLAGFTIAANPVVILGGIGCAIVAELLFDEIN